VRVSVPRYHETLLSFLMPGNTPSSQAFQPAVLALEQQMGWSKEQRRHIVLRSDGGCGTDANINWQLWRGYQMITKGFSGARAKAQGEAAQAWHEVRPGLWIAEVAHPMRYTRRTRAFLRRWGDAKQEWKYAIQIHTLLTLNDLAAIQCYDRRGAAEGEFRDDKSAWHVAQRRKQRLVAQEALVLLNDLGHNTLAWLRPWLFGQSPFATWGPMRIIRDLLNMPGEVILKGDDLHKVALSTRHPYAPALAVCLTELLGKSVPPAALR
jgi:hypothetical protein